MSTEQKTEPKIEREPLRVPLFCPNCGQQHIDVGEFATRVHRTHKCTGEAGNGPGCGHLWRPSAAPTFGIATPAPPAPDAVEARLQRLEMAISRWGYGLDPSHTDWLIATVREQATELAAARERIGALEGALREMQWVANHTHTKACPATRATGRGVCECGWGPRCVAAGAWADAVLSKTKQEGQP